MVPKGLEISNEQAFLNISSGHCTHSFGTKVFDLTTGWRDEIQQKVAES